MSEKKNLLYLTYYQKMLAKNEHGDFIFAYSDG